VNWRRSQDEGINRDVDYFQQLADGAPVMIWMAGADMGCFYFNRAWLDFRGRTTEQEFGNGWAEGVHPEDLDRCVQHYINCFGRRAAFAMSYRLLHHSGNYRWILDRGAPHFAAGGEFIGFYGGCAELSADAGVSRMAALRGALGEMRDFAERVAAVEALHRDDGLPSLRDKAASLQLEHAARQHAAAQLRNLAADMLVHDRIENGACLR
jgi:PAS domain S-box-containing protein